MHKKAKKILEEVELMEELGQEAYIERKLDKKGYYIAAGVILFVGFILGAILV